MKQPDDKQNEPSQCLPVDWYAPEQLLRTGIEVAATTLFGARADARRLAALGPQESLLELWPGELTEPLWFDFAADSGDGFASTFAVSRALASDLTVEVEQHGERLPAGRLLLLGGDQVYPTPSDNAYESRFCALYERALPRAQRDRAGDAKRFLFAVPGNHDWYDGLVEFSRVFCTKAKIGPWHTRQCGSYFALRLSPALCVFAVDTQVGGDIDREQLQHFRTIIKQGDFRERQPAVLMITAEPHWESTMKRVDICKKDRPPHLLGTLLTELEQSGARVVLHLTGDLHHYRHYASSDGRHMITAGGGGAFLHPTHTRLKSSPELAIKDLEHNVHVHKFDWQDNDFPEPHVSRKLARKNLVFFFRKPKFALLLGAIYLLLGLTMPKPEMGSLLWVFPEAMANLLLFTERAFVVALVLGGFVAFTDTSSKWYRRIGGLVHAGAHLTAALVMAWVIPRALSDWGVIPHETFVRCADVWLPEFCQRYRDYELLWPHFVYAVVTLTLGAVVGGGLWGLYLFVSVNVFKRHSNEAFSSLSIQDYKCFLRMKLEGDTLTLYPLGLRHTPRHWTWSAPDDTWTPDRAPRWELLGKAPIVIALR